MNSQFKNVVGVNTAPQRRPRPHAAASEEPIINAYRQREYAAALSVSHSLIHSFQTGGFYFFSIYLFLWKSCALNPFSEISSSECFGWQLLSENEVTRVSA